MWPFTNRATKADITAAGLIGELADCKARVRALELEWERTYDKLRGIVARMSRRNGEIEDPSVAPAPPGKPASRIRDPAITTPLLRRNY